jgi:hypothetical protein
VTSSYSRWKTQQSQKDAKKKEVEEKKRELDRVGRVVSFFEDVVL